MERKKKFCFFLKERQWGAWRYANDRMKAIARNDELKKKKRTRRKKASDVTRLYKKVDSTAKVVESNDDTDSIERTRDLWKLEHVWGAGLSCAISYLVAPLLVTRPKSDRFMQIVGPSSRIHALVRPFVSNLWCYIKARLGFFVAQVIVGWEKPSTSLTPAIIKRKNRIFVVRVLNPLAMFYVDSAAEDLSQLVSSTIVSKRSLVVLLDNNNNNIRFESFAINWISLIKCVTNLSSRRLWFTGHSVWLDSLCWYLG